MNMQDTIMTAQQRATEIQRLKVVLLATLSQSYGGRAMWPGDFVTQAQRSPHLNACDSDDMAARPHNVRLHVDQVHNDDAFTAAGVIHHDVAALDVTEPQAPVVPPLERLDNGGQTRGVPRAEASSVETDPQPQHHLHHTTLHTTSGGTTQKP